MKQTLWFLFFLIIVNGCYKAKQEYIENAINSYSDDFESYLHADSLYVGSHYNGNQLTFDGNFIAIDTTIVHSGNQSLRMFAKPSNGSDISKASLLKNDFGFENGAVVEYVCWYYISSTGGLSNFFLADFEDPAYISASPGFRIMLNADEEIVVERNKMNHSTLQQNNSVKRKFPKDRWVKLKIEFKLSQRKKGYIKIWQDDELILDHTNVITLPKDFIYVTQGTAGFLRQMEVGITANGTSSDIYLYVDDLAIRQLQ
jgi:hypothetical protein